VCQAIYTGEDTGSLGGAMTYCADILDETNTELINTVMRLIEPIILIAMGLVVGTVVASLFIPLFDLTAAM
jgi:type II secretory pathway component PulF